MSAWTNLLAASSLAIGTAWDLITHPRTGGSGGAGTVYVEQIQSAVADTVTAASVLDDAVQAAVNDETITSAVRVTDAQTALTDSTITVETE